VIGKTRYFLLILQTGRTGELIEDCRMKIEELWPAFGGSIAMVPANSRIIKQLGYQIVKQQFTCY